MKEFAISQDEKFTAQDGLFLAAALTKFDSETESIEDWRYGELVISKFGWGYSGSISEKRVPLETHQCSDQELGLAQDDDGTPQMFPLVEQSRAEVQRYKKKFKCVSAEEIAIWGDFSSARAQVIEVNFVMC